MGQAYNKWYVPRARFFGGGGEREFPMRDRNYWTDFGRRRISRRTALRGAAIGLAGLAGAALVGCSSDDDEGAGNGDAPPSAATGTAAPGATQAPTSAPVSSINYGGKLQVAVGNDPRGLDPHISIGGGDHKYFWMMTDGLVQYDREGVPDPSLSLAENWEIVDGATIRFTLREGIKFHDGEPFNADAVKRNYERILDPDVGSSAFAQMKVIESIDVVDDRTVSLTLDAPNAAFITLLGDRGGQMLSPNTFEDEDIRKADHPVGTGAFIFNEWVRDSSVLVDKNPEYWRKDTAGNALPYLDQIETLTIPDFNVAEANLESGDVHIIAPSLSRIGELEDSGNWQVEEFQGSAWSGMYLNTTLAPTDDLNFRKALAYSIDREAENEAIFFGRYVTEERPGPFSPAYKWMYPGSLDNAPKYDPAEAAKFLAASRYADDPKFTTVHNTRASTATRAALWQDFFDEIGIQMETIPLTNPGERMYVIRDVNASGPVGFSLRADPDGVASETLHTDGFYNPGHADAAEFQKLNEAIAAARSTYDLEERKDLYRDVAELAAGLVVQIYTGYSVTYRVAEEQVQNFGSIFGAEGKDRFAELWLA